MGLCIERDHFKVQESMTGQSWATRCSNLTMRCLCSVRAVGGVVVLEDLILGLGRLEAVLIIHAARHYPKFGQFTLATRADAPGFEQWSASWHFDILILRTKKIKESRVTRVEILPPKRGASFVDSTNHQFTVDLKGFDSHKLAADQRVQHGVKAITLGSQCCLNDASTRATA